MVNKVNSMCLMHWDLFYFEQLDIRLPSQALTGTPSLLRAMGPAVMRALPLLRLRLRPRPMVLSRATPLSQPTLDMASKLLLLPLRGRKH